METHLIAFSSAAPVTLLPVPLGSQAAADFAKAHLPEALRQQLLTYERERERDREKDKEKDEKKERGGLSYPSILRQQILTLDREMLDKLSATYNEAGVFLCVSVYVSFFCCTAQMRRSPPNPNTTVALNVYDN